MRSLGALALTAALLLAGCGASPGEGGDVAGGDDAGAGLRIPWQSGEVTVLEMSHDGAVIGSVTQETELGSGAWLLHTVIEVQGITERTTVHSRPEDLAPIYVEFEADTGEATVGYTAEYGEQDVVIRVEGAGGPEEASVRLPAPPYYDNEQFLHLVRALPLSDGWEARINLVVTRAASKLELPVRVAGREAVETALGTIDAWKVELKGLDQWAWVEVEPPHRLVKYENRQSRTISVLREYTPGN